MRGTKSAKAVIDWQFLDDGRKSWQHYMRTGLHVTGEEVDAWLRDLENGNFDAEPPTCHTRRGRNS